MVTRYGVQGLVQGVGFRYFVLRRARALGLRGHVRNLPDGSVEVLASGDEASLLAFERELWSGPAMANVTNVESRRISDESPVGNDFRVSE